MTEIQNCQTDGYKKYLDNRYFVPAVLILVAVISFALGRVSGLEEKREPVRVINSGEIKGISVDNSSPTLLLQQEKGAEENISVPINSSGAVVASKNGTKYHYPWCAGAKQISEKNKITFDSIEAARTAGYSPASNCQGLK